MADWWRIGAEGGVSQCVAMGLSTPEDVAQHINIVHGRVKDCVMSGAAEFSHADMAFCLTLGDAEPETLTSLVQRCTPVQIEDVGVNAWSLLASLAGRYVQTSGTPVPTDLNDKLIFMARTVKAASAMLKAHAGVRYMSDPFNAALDRTDDTESPQETLTKLIPADADIEEEGMTNYQIVITGLITEAHKQGLGRRDEAIYRPHRHPVTQRLTYAWEYVAPIRKWLEKYVARDVNPAMWQAYTGKAMQGNGNSAASYLANGSIATFPMIHPDRTVFSFSNGVYFAKENRFALTTDGPLFPAPMASNYIDQNVDPHWVDPLTDPMVIPTPSFDVIFDRQGMSTEMKHAFYGLVGRMLYRLNDLEQWQIAPFIMGVAGTGKSEVMKMIMRIYHFSDVGTMSNSIETVFGASKIATKNIIVGPEIKSDFSMDQAILQSLISGDPVSLPQKGIAALEMPECIAPMFIAGNEHLARMNDNANSMARRFAIFLWNNSVPEAERDQELPKKLYSEFAAFMVKSNRCYHEMTRTYTQGGFWNNCPKPFWDARLEGQKALNPLVSFIESEEADAVTTDAKHPVTGNCLETVFKEAFRRYCTDASIRTPVWNPNTWKGPFSQYGLKFINVTDAAGKRTRAISGIILLSVPNANGLPVNPAARPAIAHATAARPPIPAGAHVLAALAEDIGV